MRLYIVPVIGDGNCFYHALLYLINDRFPHMDTQDKNYYIMAVKRILSDNFTREYYDNNLSFLDVSYEVVFRELKYNVGYTSHYLLPFIFEFFDYNLVIIDRNGSIIPDVIKTKPAYPYICIKYSHNHYEPVVLEGGYKLFTSIENILN